MYFLAANDNFWLILIDLLGTLVLTINGLNFTFTSKPNNDAGVYIFAVTSIN